MNKQQTAALQVFTSKTDRANRLTNGEPINGALAWHIEPSGRGYIVQGSNSEGLSWYEQHICITAFVGQRGGIRIYSTH